MDLPLINDGVLVGYVGKYGPYIPEKLTYLDRINYTNDVLERKMGGPLVPGGGGLKLVSAAKAGTQKVVQGLSESLIKMDLQFFSSKTVTVSQLANFARNSKKIDGLQGIKVSSDVVNKAALDFVGQGGKVQKIGNGMWYFSKDGLKRV